jgi:lysozyme
MNLVQGVDVSVFEPRINWRTLRAQGYKFALIRATSGIGYVDPKFAAHWSGARAEGILRGAYHYLFGGQDAKRQADLFIASLGKDVGELPPIVDLEDAYNENVSNSQLISTCKAVLDLIEQAIGRRPIVYSRRSYLDDHFSLNGKAPSWANEYDVWVAQYPFKFDSASMPNANMPMQPPGWKPWTFWQYSESAIIEGVTDESNLPTRIDLDWFRGTEEELYRFAKVQPVSEQSYTVQAGDTFKEIAENFGLSLHELLNANPSLLTAGSTLKIPGRVKFSEPSKEQPIPSNPSEDTPGKTDTTKPVVMHTVAKTDTLLGIALKYHTTVDAIVAINHQITNRNIIFEGQIIVIPSS